MSNLTAFVSTLTPAQQDELLAALSQAKPAPAQPTKRESIEEAVARLSVGFTRRPTYGEVGAAIGCHARVVGAFLTRSTLSPTQQAYVVSKGNGLPGSGFFAAHKDASVQEKASIKSLLASW
jgi:alkylated DNA nucleotide flippase Atl1